MTTHVKVMGERNSGTNFLTRTLAENFDTKEKNYLMGLSKRQQFAVTRRGMPPVLRPRIHEYFLDRQHFKHLHTNGGWKHARLTHRFIQKFAEANDCEVVCVVRHPVAWAQSMHKNPFHTRRKVPASFEAFLTTPWHLRARDEMGTAPLESPLILWREKVRSYLKYAAAYPNIHVIKYEDLLLNPQEAFARISRFLVPSRPVPQLPQGRMRDFVSTEMAVGGYREKARETSLASIGKEQQALFEKYIGAELFEELSYS